MPGPSGKRIGETSDRELSDGCKRHNVPDFNVNSGRLRMVEAWAAFLDKIGNDARKAAIDKLLSNKED